MKLRPDGVGSIYLHRHPVDMRKSINGLVAIVESEMALDPFSASLFVFCNRTRTLVKLVGWGRQRLRPVDEAPGQAVLPVAAFLGVGHD